MVITTRALAQAAAVTSHNMTTGNKNEEEEEEGLQGVFKRLRRNRHQLEKNACGYSDPARTVYMHNLKQQTMQHTTQARQ
jgi:hypothetical protein